MQAQAAANRAEAQFLFAGIGAPILIAGGAIAAPAAAGLAGSYFTVSSTTGAIASGTAGFVTGGAFGVGFEFAKNRSFGIADSSAVYASAFVGGGIGGTGLRLLPNSILGRVVSERAQTAFLGALSGFGGNFAGQLVSNQGDLSRVNVADLGFATGLGAGLGGLTRLDARFGGFTVGRNNPIAVSEGLQTRYINGNISQFQLKYATKAGSATAIKEVYRQAVGATVEGIKHRVGE